MSDASTSKFLDAYLEESSAPGFLSGHFKTPAKNFHTSTKVEIDIIRDDEEVAVPIPDLSAGARSNKNTLYSNKSFTPAIFDEMGPIRAENLPNRRAGQDPFQDPSFVANVVSDAFGVVRKLERKIRRSVELMASQVLQTGVITLTDTAGATVYSLDFKPKATHLVTTTAWAADGSTGNPIGDISSLGDVVRRDGKQRPNKLIFGSTAWTRFYANADVKSALDNRRNESGRILPSTPGEDGASYMGRMFFGQYEYELWRYDGFFNAPSGGAQTPYVGDTKVIMMCDKGRLDLTYGAMPFVMEPDPRVMRYLPSRISSTDLGMAMSVRAWSTNDGKALMVSAGTRALTIPTAIDTFGCLTVA